MGKRLDGAINNLVVCALLILGLTSAIHTEAKSSKKHFRIKRTNLKVGRSSLIEVYDRDLKRSRHVKDSIIIGVKKDASDEEVEALLEANNLELVKEYDFGSKRKILAKGKSKRKFLKLLKKGIEGEIIEDADINEYKKLKSSSLVSTNSRRSRRGTNWNKRIIKQQWGIRNLGGNFGLEPGMDIGIWDGDENIWDVTQGEGVKVAVIDTGFDTGHPNINYADEGYDALTAARNNSSLAESANHILDEAAPPSAFAEEYHGTSIAGIIAGKNNNRKSVGVAPQSQIVPVRMIDPTGEVPISAIIDAHMAALNAGARIINNSWGSYDPNLAPGKQLRLSQEEEDLYTFLRSAGVFVFFSTGNEGEFNLDNSPEARHPGTIAITAVTSSGRRARYGTFASQDDLSATAMFAAPGGGFYGIVTDDFRDTRRRGRRITRGYARGGTTTTFRGTSPAAAFASGLMALMLSVNPDLSWEEGVNIMAESTIQTQNINYNYNNREFMNLTNSQIASSSIAGLATSKGQDRQMGFGIPQAYDAVQMAMALNN